jgi:ParB-like chromosome segregation protein Spo0J
MKVKENRLALEYLPLAALVEHEQNYNDHPPEQIAALRASLRQHGQTKNIVAWDLGDGRYLIAAGHGLTRAARLEGWTDIAAKVLPAEWPAEKVLAYLVADNETARRSEPDGVQLASVLAEIRSFDAALMEATGISEREYEELLAAIGGAAENVVTRSLDNPDPPRMAWVVVGIPLVRYGEVAELVELLATVDDAIVETTVNDVMGEEEEEEAP